MPTPALAQSALPRGTLEKPLTVGVAVGICIAGRILRTGGRELALELEQTGYDWVDQELAAQGAA